MFQMNCKRFFTICSLPVLLATGAFADGVDCRDYTPEKDRWCSYALVEQAKGIQLYVVPAGEDPDDISKALPNEDFYVYAPQAGNDSVSYFLVADNSEIVNKQKVTSGPKDAPYVIVGVKGLYPIYNVSIGTATLANMTDVAVSRIFNFYAPDIEYCLDEDCKNVIDNKNIQETKLEVGDTLTIYSRTVVPVGPLAGRTG